MIYFTHHSRVSNVFNPRIGYREHLQETTTLKRKNQGLVFYKRNVSFAPIPWLL